MADRIRERLLAVTERAEAAGTDLALSLSDAQLQQLERKYAKNNAEYRKDWLDRTPAQVQEKRYDQFLDRTEDFFEQGAWFQPHLDKVVAGDKRTGPHFLFAYSAERAHAEIVMGEVTVGRHRVYPGQFEQFDNAVLAEKSF